MKTKHLMGQTKGRSLRLAAVGAIALIVCALLVASMSDQARAQAVDSDARGLPVLFLGNEALPPMLFKSPNGKPTGIVFDLASALAVRMHRPVKIQLMNWTEAQQLILKGEADALLQINPNPERLKIYDFSEPLLNSEFTIFTSARRLGILSLKDLSGLKVGVENKGLPLMILKKEPQIRVEIIPDFIHGFKLLTSGALDAVVADRLVGSYVLAENNFQGVRMVDEPINRSYSAIAVKKGNIQLLREINRALSDIRRDGTYDRIINSWKTKDVVLETREQIRLKLWLIGVISASLLIALVCIAVLLREIWKRKQAEVTLSESQERLRFALESSLTGAWDLDLLDHSAFRSIEHDRIFGYDRLLPEWTYEMFLEHVIPEDRVMVDGKFRQAMEKHGDWNFECRIRREDGQVRWIWAKGRHAQDTAGTWHRMAGIVQDITDHKRMEEELRESELRYRSLVESSPDGVLVHRNGRFLFANSVALNLYGADTIEQLQTRMVLDLIHPDDRAAIEARMQQALVEQRLPLRETRMMTLDGRVIPVETVGSMVDFLGEPAVQIIIHDITNRKQSERRLFETNQRLQALMDALPVGVSYSADATCQNITGNPAVLSQFNVKSEDNLSASALDESAPGRQVRFFQEGREISDAELPLQRAVAENREIPPMELEIVLPSGVRWHAIASGAPVRDNEGNVIGGIAVTMDISKRKEAEKALQESEDHFHLALKQSPVSVAIQDRNLVYKWAYNQKTRQPDEIVGKTDDDLFVPEEVNRIIEDKRKVLETGTELHVTHWLTSNGRRMFLDIYYEPMRDSAGEITGIGITSVDLTELKQAEEELRTSENRHKLLSETMLQGVVHQDADGRIISMNPAAERILGKTREQFLGSSSEQEGYDTIFEDGKPFPGMEHPAMVALRTGQIVRGVIMGVFNPQVGDYRWIVMDAVPVSLPGKTHPAEVYTVFEDITGRKQTEAELNRHREHLEELVKERTIELKALNVELSEEITQHKRTLKALRKSALEIEDLYNNSPCGYQSLDSDGFFVRINDTELKWLGYTGEEIIGKLKFIDILTDASKKTFHETFPRFKAQGWIRDLEFDMIRKDGTIMPVLLNATAIKDRSGNFVRSRSTLFDMTDRKQIEEEKKSLENQLIQTQKMEALGSFAGGIAHDINNILYPIIIDTELLLKDTEPGTSMHLSLSQVLKAAHRQKDLVKQILSFSRRSEQLHSPIKVIPILKETMALLHASLPSTIKINQHIDSPFDIIIGDPTQIQQIILNLFRNAADAIGPGTGTIDISLANTYLETCPVHLDLKPGQYLQLIVKDSGHGMTKDVMNRIFEPFYTTKEVGKGSGLGLAVVHGILKHHGGTIIVESEVGKGSQFTVHLPTTYEEAEAKTKNIDKTHSLKGKRKVLLVDDEEVILISLRNALNRFGYDVVAVNDSVEAYELFCKRPSDFDLVITDLTMPQLTGVDLANKLMNIRHDIPVILCTGFNDRIDEERAKAMGIRELILKPASINELKTAIDRALEN